jgi:hypothetical protein
VDICDRNRDRRFTGHALRIRIFMKARKHVVAGGGDPGQQGACYAQCLRGQRPRLQPYA